MQPTESKGVPTPGRKICFCVAKWSDSTTVLTWAWLRQYFLHRDTDELYIVHTGKGDKWKAAGPLGPDLDTALQQWPHQIVLLPGTLQSNIAKFIIKNGIDVVVLSEDFPRQSGFQIVSVSDWVRQNITCPFIIIRASAVRNDRLRLASRSQLDANARQKTQELTPEAAPGRRVAIAYPSFPIGQYLMELSKQMVLLPQDEIFVVHCFTGEKTKLQTTKSLLIRTITLGLADTAAIGVSDKSQPTQVEVTEENSMEFGAKELAGYNVHLGVVLRGDPRTALVHFCETEDIELLVISTRMAGFIKKTLSGGSVSGYLIDKAPCPCLVAPLKSMSAPADEEEWPLSPNSSIITNEWAVPGTSPPPGTSPKAAPISLFDAASNTALQVQLEEKDRIIARLRQEVAEMKAALAKSIELQEEAVREEARVLLETQNTV